MKQRNIVFIFICIITFAFVGCNQIDSSDNANLQVDNSSDTDKTENVTNNDDIILTVSSSSTEKSYTLEQLKSMEDATFEGIYSTINNWPTFGTYAARGITIEGLLSDAGVLEEANTITVTSSDGFSQSFTKNQLVDAKQYYYVDGVEKSEVKNILSYEYKEDSTDLDEAEEGELRLVIGQTDPNRYTNFAFVEDVTSITVSSEEDQWSLPYSFPSEGSIESGEKIKLQHDYIGIAKIYYTTDGTEPTPYSKVYNISTYRPELNEPIVVEKDTVIKAFVSGFGKKDSEIATMTFTVK